MMEQNKTTIVQFDIDSKVFMETPSKRITNMTLVIEYDNPQAYGYPDVWSWTEEYKFDVDKIRRKING